MSRREASKLHDDAASDCSDEPMGARPVGFMIYDVVLLLALILVDLIIPEALSLTLS
jgi:hypothetical protein